MVELDVFLASQQRRSLLSHAPEYRLMIAVLENALHCLDKHRLGRDARSQEMFQETAAWVLADDGDWLYSFAGICAALNLNPSAVRRQLFRSEQPEKRGSLTPPR